LEVTNGHIIRLTEDQAGGSLRKTIASLRAISLNNGEVLSITPLPHVIKDVLAKGGGGDMARYRASSVKDLIGSKAEYSEYYYIGELDRYMSTRPCPKGTLMISTTIPAQIIENHFKHAFLTHLKRDRNWKPARPSKGKLTSADTEGCYNRALELWCAGSISAATLAEAKAKFIGSLKKAEYAEANKAKTKSHKVQAAEDKQTISKLRKEMAALTARLDEAHADKEKLKDIAEKATRLARESPGTGGKSPSISDTEQTEEPETGDNPEEEDLEDEPPAPTQSDIEREERIDYIVSRKGLTDPKPDPTGKNLLTEMIRMRPELCTCYTCGVDWPIGTSGEDHKCEELLLPKTKAAPDSAIDREIKRIKAARTCTYRLCRTRETHVTRACPYLHGRCPECHCRGHDTVPTPWNGKAKPLCPFLAVNLDQCMEVDGAEQRIPAKSTTDGWMPPTFEDLYEIFEERADLGWLTRFRTLGHPAAGFYPVYSFKDTLILKALGHEQTKSVAARQVVAIMHSISKAFRETPGLMDNPGFMELADSELVEIRDRQWENGLNAPDNSKRSNKRTRSGHSEGSDLNTDPAKKSKIGNKDRSYATVSKPSMPPPSPRPYRPPPRATDWKDTSSESSSRPSTSRDTVRSSDQSRRGTGLPRYSDRSGGRKSYFGRRDRSDSSYRDRSDSGRNAPSPGPSRYSGKGGRGGQGRRGHSDDDEPLTKKGLREELEKLLKDKGKK
jgi:hypothetical protein